MSPTDKIAFISEDLCIGCGICAKVFVHVFHVFKKANILFVTMFSLVVTHLRSQKKGSVQPATCKQCSVQASHVSKNLPGFKTDLNEVCIIVSSKEEEYKFT